MAPIGLRRFGNVSGLSPRSGCPRLQTSSHPNSSSTATRGSAISRGNVYDAEYAAAEHLESYLRTVFGFIGVTDLEFVAADGVQLSPEHRQRALKGTLESAGQLPAA